MTTGTTAAPGYWWNGWIDVVYEPYTPCCLGHVFRWASNHTGDKEPPDGTVCECGAVVWGTANKSPGSMARPSERKYEYRRG